MLDHRIQDRQGDPWTSCSRSRWIRVSRLSIRVMILALAAYGNSSLT
jgi:hypothetical protein